MPNAIRHYSEEAAGKFFITKLLQILEDSYWDDLKEEGERKGERRLSNLLKILKNTGRDVEFSRVLEDEEYRKELMGEFNL